jgi:hypothetical protein
MRSDRVMVFAQPHVRPFSVAISFALLSGLLLIVTVALTPAIAHSDAPAGAPKDSRPEFGAFSHLLDPQPTEIHVFVSLYAKVPLIIMTVNNGRVWPVVAGKIGYVEKTD